jgi:hypothetical protein
METSKIYVYLLDEGTDCWRPVQAAGLGADRYRIVSENDDPEDEHWQFTTGDVVRCMERQLSGGRHLVAIEKLVDTTTAEP